ncbi:hypothetical protein DL767_009736 [Monosporascus sp. MG133]|nr:hypothetical protein DL767_009736 [Monosporascus sp. MG133]
MPPRGRKRSLSSDSADGLEATSDSESSDDAGVPSRRKTKPTRSSRWGAAKQSLLRADAELEAEIKELFNNVKHDDFDLVEACRWLHGLDAKIEAHEAKFERLAREFPASSSCFAFPPTGRHRKSSEDIDLEITLAKLGVLEKLKREAVAARESASSGLESLKRQVEAIKASQISAEVIKKVIKETHAFQVTKQLEASHNSIAATLGVSEPKRRIPSHWEVESKRVCAWNFAEHLKTLDFRAPHGIWGWSNVSLQFQAYHLWANDHSKYVLRDQLTTPLCAERHERGYARDHSDKDSLKSLGLRSYTQSVMELEICEPSQVPTSLVLPKYVTFLGNLFGAFSGSERGRPSYETSANNLCLVMDVTKPSKSVWLVYRYEFRKGGNILEYEFHQDKDMFSTMEKEFDLALVCEYIRDWEEPNGSCELPHLNNEKVEDAMRRTACRVKPVFTRPNLDDLLVAIEEGWAGHGDGRNPAEAD